MLNSLTTSSMLFALFVATSQADVEVGDQKSLLFIQLKIATFEDLVQLAEDVALQVSTSFLSVAKVLIYFLQNQKC